MLDELIEPTSRLAVPVLHTLRVPTPVAPMQVSAMGTLPGIWICGTSPTIRALKNKSIVVEAGTIEGGDVADAQAAKRRPAAQATPL
jgi:hypothetical protein